MKIKEQITFWHSHGLCDREKDEGQKEIKMENMTESERKNDEEEKKK